MEGNNSNNKLIAKNTIIMYIRMLFVMAVSLYTSRVILNVLGVEDYGTYQVVGGVVGLLAFINITLGQGTSRFLLFEMGRGDKKSVSRLFSTLVNALICIALFIIILAETVGLWFVYNKLVIPEDRLGPAVLAYHLSIITSFFSLTQVPYSAAIKSHERFNIYAYISIFDVIAKLAIVYLLKISPIDKLSFYALLLCIETIVVILFMRIYCSSHFEETKYHFLIDMTLLKKVASYCGWNFFSNISGVLNTQGLYILVNMFFNSGVVTSIAVATTVKDAANSFVENFRVAAVPQTVKSYAAGNVMRSKSLLLNTTKYSYYLLLVLGLPIFLVAPELLRLWLGFIPEYADIFLRYIIVISFFMLFNSCLFTAQDVVGKIKKYSLTYPFMMLLNIVAIYLCFKNGASPISYANILLITYVIIAIIIQPYLVTSQTEYSYKEIFLLYLQCLYVTALAVVIPIISYFYLPPTYDFIRILLITIISIISVLISVWYVGLSSDVQKKILNYLKLKFKKLK